MSGTRLLIWDFDGTLAHRRGETGWSILLAEALDAEEPGHGHSADRFRPHLREGFPWHRPEVAHPELCEPEAWWASVRPVLGRAYEAAGYAPARALELADAARRLYVDPKVGWELFEDTLPALERLSQAGWTHAILSNHVPGAAADRRRARSRRRSSPSSRARPRRATRSRTRRPSPRCSTRCGPPRRGWSATTSSRMSSAPRRSASRLVLVRRPDPRAARYADSLSGVEAFLSSLEAPHSRRRPARRRPRRLGGGRMSDVLREQKRYYAERAPEYDDWWYRRGRYELEP